MYKTIVFDMDGTLIDTDAIVLNTYKALTKSYPPDKKLAEFDSETLLSKNYSEIIKQLYLKPEQAHLDYIYEKHQSLIVKHIGIFDHVIKTLETLKAHGIKLYVFTSELRQLAITELIAVSIYHFFDDIIAFEDVDRPKPDPEGLLKLMLKKQLNKHEVLYVGNSHIDGMAAKQAGIKSILINHLNGQDKLIYFDDVIDNMSELIPFIHDYEPAYRFRFDKNSQFNILQLTDLHLMGNDKDIYTKRLIHKLVKQTKPDLICFTGDQTMSTLSPELYKQLGLYVEQYHIPWTFVFGNHDTDFDVPYEILLEQLKDCEHLIFKKGQKQLGIGNFFIELRESRKTKGLLFFFDTHVDDFYMIDDKPVWGYGMLNELQLKWYERVVNQYHQPYEVVPSSLMFMHIPPYEFRLCNQQDERMYDGSFEEKPQTPPIKNKLFDYIHQLNSTKGIFVGHDHYNDFSFYHDNVLLAYGRVSGYYEYGRSGFEKGGRLISLSSDGLLKTHIIKLGKGKKKQD